MLQSNYRSPVRTGTTHEKMFVWFRKMQGVLLGPILWQNLKDEPLGGESVERRGKWCGSLDNRSEIYEYFKKDPDTVWGVTRTCWSEGGGGVASICPAWWEAMHLSALPSELTWEPRERQQVSAVELHARCFGPLVIKRLTSDSLQVWDAKICAGVHVPELFSSLMGEWPALICFLSGRIKKPVCFGCQPAGPYP